MPSEPPQKPWHSQTGIRPEWGAREPNGEVTTCVASEFWF
jgi:hypothetical protein